MVFSKYLALAEICAFRFRVLLYIIIIIISSSSSSSNGGGGGGIYTVFQKVTPKL